MTHYIALIHKDADSCYGMTFPGLPGVTTAADSLDAVLERAVEALTLAAEDWEAHVGYRFPSPRSLDDLRDASDFINETAGGAVVAAIAFRTTEKAVA